MHCIGFDPYLPKDPRVLVLGSFPSVKSRAEGFYYGNPQNRFWKVLALAADAPTPATVEGKKALSEKTGVALWDMVISCEITGSMDKDIRDPVVADLNALLARRDIPALITNGATAYAILRKHFPALLPRTIPLPSTSPANARLRIETWIQTLRLHIKKS